MNMTDTDTENNFPRTWKNPTKEYLEMERRFKGNTEHIADEAKLAIMIFKGYRLTRNEFSNAVRLKLIIKSEDTDEAHERFMSRWKETKTQFGLIR